MVILRLPVVEPFDWPLALRMIGAHAVPGGERLDPQTAAYVRVLNGIFGPLAVTIRARPAHLSVCLDGDLVTDEDAAAVIARVRHWLDLDLDPAQPLARSPPIRRLVRSSRNVPDCAGSAIRRPSRRW